MRGGRRGGPRVGVGRGCTPSVICATHRSAAELFRLATQILHAYRMVHKINTDRLYEMHGTPGGTMRDPELKIVYTLHACTAVLGFIVLLIVPLPVINS